jgi:uncharacterized protein (DUF2062 family)
LVVLRHPHNCGKGRALQTGFAHALAAGYSHAITLDADGQHFPADIAVFGAELERRPEAQRLDTLLLGSRAIREAGAGYGSRVGGAISNFWTWVATGHRLPDTQTGFRCYPLARICDLYCTKTGYDFELEVIVKAAWSGVQLASVPIQVRYFEGDERVSHMKPLRDFMRIGWLYTQLCTMKCSFPAPYLSLRCLERFHALPLRQRLEHGFRELLVKEPGSPRRIAGSVGLGLFMGIAPFWGFQIALTLLIAHIVGASKVIAVVASNISFPVMIPPILYGSLVLGRLVVGNERAVEHWSTLKLQPPDFWAYVLGSFILAALVAITGGMVTLFLARSYQRLRLRNVESG